MKIEMIQKSYTLPTHISEIFSRPKKVSLFWELEDFASKVYILVLGLDFLFTIFEESFADFKKTFLDFLLKIEKIRF